MTDGNVNEATGVRTAEAQPGSGAASGSVATVAYKKMMQKKLRNDRRKTIAFDLLMTQEYIARPRAAQALRIARRLV